MAKTLPKFDETVGPQSARYFRAEALSRRLQAQRDKNSAEHRELLDRTPAIRDRFTRENVRSAKKEPTLADRVLAEIEGDAEAQAEEAAPAGPTEADRDALSRSRKLNENWQDVRDALLELGDRKLHFHSLACREFCSAIRDQHYRPVAEDVAQALLALAHAVDRHDAFLAELHAQGVTQRSNLLLIETPKWRDMLRQLNSAVEHDYLEKSAVNPEWRNK